MLSTETLDTLFKKARSHKGWLNKDITNNQIHQIYDLLKFAPTSGNCCPARFTFIQSSAAKNRIKPSLDMGNIDKTMSAPCVVIISYDTKFYESLPTLSPHNDAKSFYDRKDKYWNCLFLQNITLPICCLVRLSLREGRLARQEAVNKRRCSQLWYV